MRSGTYWIISLLSAAAGAGVVYLLQSPRGDRPRASPPGTDIAIPETPPKAWHLTVTLAGTTDPPRKALRVIQVYRSGSSPPRMTSVLDQDRLLDADPVGNLDRYQARLVLSDLAAGRIYELSRRAILAHRLSPAERTICDGTTLSLRLDIGDTGIEISFDHSMRPPDEVLELVASLDGELPEKHRLGRGGYALEGRRAGPR